MAVPVPVPARATCLVAPVLALVLFLLAGVAAAGPVYFVVAERPGSVEKGDSFALPLTSEADIAHARDLIDRGPDAAGSAIVFAEISAGADGINRDVLAPGEPLWNWHVSGFEGFGDIGIELVDGNPTLVEEDVQGWILNTRRGEDDATGHIGFWNYTIVSEMGDPPAVPLPAVVPTGLIGLLVVVVARGRRAAPWREA